MGRLWQDEAVRDPCPWSRAWRCSARALGGCGGGHGLPLPFGEESRHSNLFLGSYSQIFMVGTNGWSSKAQTYSSIQMSPGGNRVPKLGVSLWGKTEVATASLVTKSSIWAMLPGDGKLQPESTAMGLLCSPERPNSLSATTALQLRALIPGMKNTTSFLAEKSVLRTATYPKVNSAFFDVENERSPAVPGGGEWQRR